MSKEILYGIVGFVVGVLIGILFAQNAVNNNVTGIMQMMGISQTRNKNNTIGVINNIDRHFIEQMIPHHEDAITMAKIAQDKAKHPEIKKLAEDIIKDQSEEISKMKDWYKNWFGSDVPKNGLVMGIHGMAGVGRMHMGMMGNDTDIQRLNAVADFDKAFIEEMIPHHQMAVMMANMLSQGTNRPEMKQLAQDIITAQTKEINEMRQWYENWGY